MLPFFNIYAQTPGSDCQYAITVSAGGCSTVGQYDNTGVTGTLSPPSCFGSGANNGMWFKFAATGPVVNVTVNGGTLAQPMITLLSSTGACVSPFTELACANSGTVKSSVDYSALTPGTVYYIYVDGANDLVGAFQLCLTSPAQPQNDKMCNAITLPTNSFCSPDNAYTNVGATPDMMNSTNFYPPSCWTDGLGANNGVWFKFVATGNQTDVTVSGFTTPILAVLTPANGDCNSTDFANFAFRSCGQSTTGTSTTASSNSFVSGQTYYILVDGFNSTTGTFKICVNSYTPSATLVNDICSGSIALCPNSTITGTTSGGNPNATTDPPVQWGSGGSGFNCNGDNNFTVYYDFWTDANNSPVSVTIKPNCVDPGPTADPVDITNLLQVGIFGFTGASPCVANKWTKLVCDASNQVVGQSFTLATTSAITTANSHYYIVFDSWPSLACGFDMTITGNRGTTAGNDQTVCANAAAFTLTGFSPSSGGTWSGPGITSPSGTFDPAVAGIGKHVLFYTNGACTDTKIITVTGPTVNVSNGANLCSNECITLIGDATQIQTITSTPSFSSASSLNLTIPDGNTTGVSSPIAVSGLTNATVASVTVNIAHTWVGDVSIYLVCPDGTNLPLSTANGGSGDNYTNTVFSYNATTNISSASPPFTGSFTPEGGSFSPINNCTMNGNWTLLVVDDASGITGKLTNWSISFLNNVQNIIPANYAWSPTTDMTGSTTLNPQVCPTTLPSTTTYYLTATDANGCIAKDSAIVSISNCSCTITASNSGPICPGGTFSLTASNVTDAQSYSWTGPNGYTSTSQNPTGLTASSAPGSYTYTVTAQLSTGGNCVATTTVTVNPLPTVNAGNDVSICPQATTVLSATGTATNYTWDNGATNGGTVSPASQTTYTVTGTDANGCVKSDEVIVSLYQLPAIVASNDVAICSGASTTLTVSGGTTYSWTPSTGLSAVSGASVSANPIALTTYTVTGVDANGCQNTDNVTVTVNSLPIVNAGIDAPICNGQTTTLSASGASTYVWSPSINLSSTTSATVDANPSATITYTVTGTDANNCSASDDVVITVNPNTPVDAGTDQPICLGQSVTLTASGSSTYVWSPSTGLSSTTIADVTANPTQTTTYTVTGTSVNGCVTTDQVVVTVNPLPIVDAGNISPICLGSNVTLSGSGASSYVWNNGITDGVPFTPSVPGDFIYNVTGTDANGCENTDQVTIKVFQLPLAVFSADVLSGQTPLNVNFTNSSQMANTYSWDFGNGVAVNTTDLSPVSTTYSTAGVFTVTLVASNGICTDDQILIITTGTPPPMEIFVPNVFTPNDKEDNEGYWVNVINGKSFEGVIVNRWGNVMYTMGELNEKWDGNYNGKPAEDGVYFIKYTATGLDGEVKEGHTFFHLVR